MILVNSSDSNLRVVEILNFLASRPTESFTLTELASRLDLSNGTAHRVLSSLANARYLYRHPKHRTYSLGVALVALGQAALEKHRGVEVARREMIRLAAEVKAQCMLTTIVDDEILFVAKEGIPYSREEFFRIGERRPFLPPLGLLQIAWAGEDQQSIYQEKARQILGDDQFAHMQASIPEVRRLGYTIAASGESLDVIGEVAPAELSEASVERSLALARQFISGLTPSEIFEANTARLEKTGVAYISAPVFSDQGQVAFEISLSGLPENLDAREIERYIKRLCAAAALVTKQIYGRRPSL